MTKGKDTPEEKPAATGKADASQEDLVQLDNWQAHLATKRGKVNVRREDVADVSADPAEGEVYKLPLEEIRTGANLHLLNERQTGLAARLRSASTIIPPDAHDENAEKGREASQAIEESNKIKSLARVRKMGLAEIRHAHPDFAIWKMVDASPGDSKEEFEKGPRRWERGFIRNVFLPRYYSRSLATIKKWMKAARQRKD